jgi:hypothetical protein
VRPAALALSLLLAAQGSTLKQLGGGALGGATFAFIIADAAWLAKAGPGWPLAVSTGLAWTFGAGVGAGIAHDEQRAPWPSLVGAAIGLTFAASATLLASSTQQRLIIGIPATLVLPLVMAVLANAFARPVDDSA